MAIVVSVFIRRPSPDTSLGDGVSQFLRDHSVEYTGPLIVRTDPATDWIELTYSGLLLWLPNYRGLAMTVSLELTAECLFVYVDSMVNAIRFGRYAAGRAVRELEYGCKSEGRWELVKGTREPWESAAFSSGGAAESGEPTASIAEGSNSPHADARGVLSAIADHYGFRGYRNGFREPLALDAGVAVREVPMNEGLIGWIYRRFIRSDLLAKST